MERVLVTGGRDYGDFAHVNGVLDGIHAARGIAAIIHGAATGADSIADEWARRHSVEVDQYPAKWDDIDAPGAIIRVNRFGKPYNIRAGFMRNEEMVRRSCPTIAIAFPGGNGTDDCVKQIRRSIRAGAAVEFLDLRYTTVAA